MLLDPSLTPTQKLICVAAVGIALGGFGLFAMRVVPDDPLFFVLTFILASSGGAIALYGIVGLLERQPLAKSTEKDLKAIRSLIHDLKVRYPTYILKVQELKAIYDELQDKLPEVRNQSEAFKQQIQVYQAMCAELEVELDYKLQQHAAAMADDNVEGIAKKILWSEQQIQLAELGSTLKTLAETALPITPEAYHSALSRVSPDFKKLERGATLYRDLLTACTNAIAPIETALTTQEKLTKSEVLAAHNLHQEVVRLELSVAEIDARMSTHETELRTLGTDTRARAERAEEALSTLQARFETFKSAAEVLPNTEVGEEA